MKKTILFFLALTSLCSSSIAEDYDLQQWLAYRQKYQQGKEGKKISIKTETLRFKKMDTNKDGIVTNDERLIGAEKKI